MDGPCAKLVWCAAGVLWTLGPLAVLEEEEEEEGGLQSTTEPG
jgi:hypothetical protein